MEQYYAPDFEVKVQGLTLESNVKNAVINLMYDNSIEQADMFQLTLNNGDLQLTDSPLFDVGKEVEIHMGYVGDLKPMMLGEIVSVQPSFPSGGAATISVTGYDKSHRMRLNKPGRYTFKYLNDSAIAAQIAAENLLIPIVDPTPMPPRESVQQTASDWTFLRELADRNFFEVFVHWDKLYFRLPRPQTEKIVLEWGKNLSSFAPRLSTSGQSGIQVVRGYDYKLAQSIVAVLPAISLGADLDDITERLGSNFIDKLVNLGRNVIRDKPVNNYFEATVLAKSVLKQLLDGLYEGSGSCIGLPKLRAGEVVDIRGLGKRFSGNYRLSKVKHTINGNGYRTQFEVTQKYTSSLLQSLRKKISERLLSNPQQKEYGVVIGIVQNNVDPEGLGRVQLSFPHLSDVNLSQWARIASPMAGNSLSGIYFLPDVGDEVLVAFRQGYVDEPIVIGGLWNGSSRPPEVNTGLNEKKVIRLNSGMQIMFDETPGLEKISIKVDEGNFIEVSRTGVKVKGTLIELN